MGSGRAVPPAPPQSATTGGLLQFTLCTSRHTFGCSPRRTSTRRPNDRSARHAAVRDPPLPAPSRFRRPGRGPARHPRARREGSGGVLGRGGAAPRLDHAVDPRTGMEPPRTRAGSPAAPSTSRPTASIATSPARGATRPPSSGKASRAIAGCSPTGTWPARSAGGQCAPPLGVKRGDRVAIYLPRFRSRHRDAGLRPHRSGPLRGLRRILGRIAPGPDQRRGGRRPHHRRRRVSSGTDRAAQGFADEALTGAPASGTSSWSAAARVPRATRRSRA